MNGRLLSLLKKPVPEKLNALRNAYYRIKAFAYYRRVFGEFGSGSVLFPPLLLSNPRFMHIGESVSIRQGARLEAVVSDPAHPPELRIGNNVNIEQNVHIVCHSKIIIGSNVSITGNCAIVDVTHPYEDVRTATKIGDRILRERSYVEIGDGSFIGFNTAILPNVRIGRHCVLGAHSLITRDVPDYCVAAGNPARIVRRYDLRQDVWVRETDKGTTRC